MNRHARKQPLRSDGEVWQPLAPRTHGSGTRNGPKRTRSHLVRTPAQVSCGAGRASVQGSGRKGTSSGLLFPSGAGIYGSVSPLRGGERPPGGCPLLPGEDPLSTRRPQGHQWGSAKPAPTALAAGRRPQRSGPERLRRKAWEALPAAGASRRAPAAFPPSSTAGQATCKGRVVCTVRAKTARGGGRTAHSRFLSRGAPGTGGTRQTPPPPHRGAPRNTPARTGARPQHGTGLRPARKWAPRLPPTSLCLAHLPCRSAGPAALRGAAKTGRGGGGGGAELQAGVR